MSAASLAIAFSARVQNIDTAAAFAVPGQTHIALYPRRMNGELPLALHPRVQAIEGVRPGQVFFFSHLSGRGPDGFHFNINGASRGWLERFGRPPYLQLDEAQLARFNADPLAVIVTENTLEKMGWRAGEDIEMSTFAGPLHGRASVIVAPGYAMLNKVIMHGEALDDQLQPPRRGRTSWVMVGVDPRRFEQVSREIEALYESANDPVWTFSVWDVNDYLIRHFVGHPDTPPVLDRAWIQLAALLHACTLVIVACVLAIDRRARHVRRGEVLSTLGLWLLGSSIGVVVTFALFHRDGLELGSWFYRNVTVTALSAGVAVGCALVEGLAIEALFVGSRWLEGPKR